MRFMTFALLLGVLLVSIVIQTGIGVHASTGAAPQNAITVNSTADLIADDGQCTLREAITAANTDTASGAQAGECVAGNGMDTILLSSGTYSLMLKGRNEDANQTGDLDVASDIVIQGAGRATTAIDGNRIDRIFHQHSGTVQIQGLTITNGQAPHGDMPGANGAGGGGILLADGTLTLIESDVRSNKAGNGATGTSVVGGSPAHGGQGGKGGGILQSGGTLVLNEVNLTRNKAGNGGNGGTGGNSKLQGGNGGDGGAGGGIYTEALLLLTLKATTLDNNEAGSGGASSGMPGVWVSGAGGRGGGIFGDGNTTITASTLSRNRTGATGGGSVPGMNGNGGGAYLRNSTLINSTISQNEVQTGNGSGIYSTESITLTSVTVAYNHGAAEGGGLYVQGVARGANTILNQNSATYGDECFGEIESLGYLLVGPSDPDFPVCQITGTTTGNLLGANAQLMPLNYYGGPTETHALMTYSMARDAGNCFGVMIDQRGVTRPHDFPNVANASDGCDIGAYEDLGASPTHTPTSTATSTITPSPLPTRTPTASLTPLPPGDIIVNSASDVIADDGACTLREAITAANTDTASGNQAGECVAGSGADIVILPPGTYLLTLNNAYDNYNQGGDLDIRSDITLLGSSQNDTIIDGTQRDRVLHIVKGTVSLENLKITGGMSPNGGYNIGAHPGGGIYLGIESLNVTLSSVIVQSNRTGYGGYNGDGGNGAGVAHYGGGLLSIQNSVFRDNHAGSGGPPSAKGGHGGAIYSMGSMELDNTTIEGNTAGYAGVDYPDAGRGGDGGGIYSSGLLTITNSTISGNGAGSAPIDCPFCGAGGVGGGIWNHGGLITNSTISGNWSGDGFSSEGVEGGGIYVRHGELTLTSVTISRNKRSDYEGPSIYLSQSATMMMANTVLAETSCRGTIISLGYNFVGTNPRGGCELQGDTTGNRSGDPRLFALADNLGPTKTHAFYPNSPLRDAGHCFGVPYDQRGIARPQDLPEDSNISDGCDMGAYEELGFPPPTPTITPTATVPSSNQTLYLPIVQRATP